MVDLNRRGFFRGRPRPQAQIRPPWALPEAAFIDACTRCDECLKACPQGIVISGDGGFPSIDFSRGECTFCGACANACQPHALDRRDAALPWAYRATIAPTCLPQQGVECRICGDFCEIRAIRFTPRLGGVPLPSIDLERCTGCGACVAPCPSLAIRILVPTQSAQD